MTLGNELFVLIPGRTSRQGTSLNEGKRKPDFMDETQTALFHPEDMARLHIAAGQAVKLISANGDAVLFAKAASQDELSHGMIFVPYGPPICALIGGETHGTGMPDSKCIDVRVEVPA